MARIIAPRKKGDTNTLAAIKANENFVVRLTPEPNSQDSSNYRVTITIEGRGSNGTVTSTTSSMTMQF